MNFCSPFPQRFLAGCAALLLFAGLAWTAQQSGDKSKKETPKAGANGVGMPQCQYCPAPEYSDEARKKKYQGVVVLLVVVTTEGRAADIRIVKTPGLGLEEKSIDAVRKWRFKPAMKDGAPVDVEVPIEVTFRLGPS